MHAAWALAVGAAAGTLTLVAIGAGTGTLREEGTGTGTGTFAFKFAVAAPATQTPTPTPTPTPTSTPTQGQASTQTTAISISSSSSPSPSPSPSSSSTSPSSPSSVSSLPVYTLAQVSSHTSPSTGIWVTYQGSVYDITSFVSQHPGGPQKIVLAAGGALEPFWSLYQQHSAPFVQNILAQFKIGTLHPDDVKQQQQQQQQHADEHDPYKHDPPRHPALTVVSKKPFNAETPAAFLSEYITPNELFFTRNHLPVPIITPESYELKVVSLDGTTHSYTLDELKSKFPKKTITATIQCAGNRRSEMNQVRPVKGLEWGVGAISNATWSGVSLRDVLSSSGIDVNEYLSCGSTSTSTSTSTTRPAVARHVHFSGLDSDMTGTQYGASIPISRALSPEADVLLAYEMNGTALPRDHGFPLRVIAPGIVGARQVKWLGSISLSSVECPSHWQQSDYKGFSPATDWGNVVWNSAPAIQQLPVQSAITTPTHGTPITIDHDELQQQPDINTRPEQATKANFKPNPGTPASWTYQSEVSVRGYAWSGGGRAVVRVDVSGDNGATWMSATLNPHEMQQADHVPPTPDNNPDWHTTQAWAWKTWEASVPVTGICKRTTDPGTGTLSCTPVQLTCKAVDSSYNVQPETMAGLWTFRGVLGNSWHRITLPIQAPPPPPHQQQQQQTNNAP